MTLLQKLNSLISRLEEVKSNVVTSLYGKGVVQEEDFKVSDIPSLIDKIYQPDFEFFFNFKEIDQFGNPHTLMSGQATGGMANLGVYCNDFVLPLVFYFKEETTAVNAAHYPGQFGTWIGSTHGVDIVCDDFTCVKLEAFNNQSVINEELHYDDTLVG